MSIVPTAEVFSFLGVTQPYYTITAVNNVLLLSYNGGSDTAVTITDGTYTGDELAAQLETQIDTAFTITSTVTYSSTTYKFTIAPGANTIAFTLAGSDAAATLGFTADKAAATSITSDVGTGDDTAIISTIHTAVEAYIKKYYDREFESTAHVNERYSGDGKIEVYLRDYPVTAFQKVAVGQRDVIRIKNTQSYTDSSVSVTSTGVVLNNDEAATATVDFATYATIATVVAQINATGSGWTASVSQSRYNNFKSTQLLPKFGLSTIDDTWVDLSIPDEAQTVTEVDENTGILYMQNPTPRGVKNLYVSYTGGYSAAAMPDDLKLAINIIIKEVYQKREEEIYHVTDYKLGEVAATLQNGIPQDAQRLLDNYMRFRI